jgi:hypothetical protein
MSATLNFTEADVFTVIRGFLLQYLPTPIEVIKAQVNRVPEPATADFVLMTPVNRVRLETNTDTFLDGYPSLPSTVTALAPTKLSVQFDIHGPASSQNAQIITTLFRDYVATDYFLASTTIDAQPLSAGDPKQVPFVNAEDQWEDRWTFDVELQLNQTVTVPQQFFDQIDVGLINVDAVYPP